MKIDHDPIVTGRASGFEIAPEHYGGRLSPSGPGALQIRLDAADDDVGQFGDGVEDVRDGVISAMSIREQRRQASAGNT